MRAVVQRVSQASVSVDGSVVGEIAAGLLVLVGVAAGDTDDDATAIADRVSGLRIFPDDAGKMNRSVVDTGGSALIVSQFTLLGDVVRGRRPSFTAAASPDVAEPLVARVSDAMASAGIPVQGGRFGAHMQVASVNDGPVTIVLETVGGRLV